MQILVSAKIVSSGSTVSIVDLDSAGANTRAQATEITTNGISDNGGTAIQIPACRRCNHCWD